MNAQRIVAVVLAARSEDASWDGVRYAASFCGMSAPQRVEAAARAAGASDVVVLADSKATPVPDLNSAVPSRYSAEIPSRRALGARLEGCRVLAVCADLPLLTADTVADLLRAAEGDPQATTIATGGAVAVLGAGADPVALLYPALIRFDRAPFETVARAWTPADPEDLRRLATPADLPALERIARRRKLGALVAAGVIIEDDQHTYVDDAVGVAAGTRILAGTHLVGQTTVGRLCVVGPDAWVENSAIEDGAVVRYSVIESARVRERSTVGPFAHLRAGADVGPEARIGNFVEVKAARLGHGVKAGHLSYLGDAEIGAGTNVGAGTITCNYDGRAKHRTVIEDGAFVGSHVALVAPVTIGRGAFVAAGSTITEDVPAQMLAIGRARQVVKERNETASREEGA